MKSQKFSVLEPRSPRSPRRGRVVRPSAGAGPARPRVVVVDMIVIRIRPLVLCPPAYPKSFFSSRFTVLSHLSSAASGSPPLRTQSANRSSVAVIMAWVQPMLSKCP